MSSPEESQPLSERLEASGFRDPQEDDAVDERLNRAVQRNNVKGAIACGEVGCEEFAPPTEFRKERLVDGLRAAWRRVDRSKFAKRPTDYGIAREAGSEVVPDVIQLLVREVHDTSDRRGV